MGLAWCLLPGLRPLCPAPRSPTAGRQQEPHRSKGSPQTARPSCLSLSRIRPAPRLPSSWVFPPPPMPARLWAHPPFPCCSSAGFGLVRSRGSCSAPRSAHGRDGQGTGGAGERVCLCGVRQLLGFAVPQIHPGFHEFLVS